MADAVWHGAKAKQEIHFNTRQKLIAMGNRVETYAKQYCPIDTGLAMSSLQTVEKRDGVYVGSDIAKFREVAVSRGIATGGLTFYLPYIEKGHVMRNGVWWEGYHFLARALDKVRQENGAL